MAQFAYSILTLVKELLYIWQISFHFQETFCSRETDFCHMQLHYSYFFEFRPYTNYVNVLNSLMHFKSEILASNHFHLMEINHYLIKNYATVFIEVHLMKSHLFFLYSNSWIRHVLGWDTAKNRMLFFHNFQYSVRLG